MNTLKERFEKLIHLPWSQFLEIKNNKKSTVDDSVLCSLIDICANTDDIAAIKLAFDRIDGLLETPIEVKVPKFYVRYVNAKGAEEGQKQIENKNKQKKKKEFDPATAKLRETLAEMREYPQEIIKVALGYKKLIESGKKADHDPMVKSIIVANLLYNARKGRFKAVELIFDQIDGKLTRVITLLGGEDVYADDYNTVTAPAHAFLDENGVYVAEDKLMTAQWLRGFANSQKGLEMLSEGLEDEYGI